MHVIAFALMTWQKTLPAPCSKVGKILQDEDMSFDIYKLTWLDWLSSSERDSVPGAIIPLSGEAAGPTCVSVSVRRCAPPSWKALNRLQPPTQDQTISKTLCSLVLVSLSAAYAPLHSYISRISQCYLA